MKLLSQSVKRAALLRERAQHGRAIADIDVQLAELESQTVEPDVYGSRAPYPPLPNLSYKTTRELAAKMHAAGIAGVERVGGKRGRGVVWTITRDAYKAWLDAQRAPAPSNVVKVDESAWTEGYRMTRSA